MIRGERWQQVKELLDEALDQPLGDRRAFLAKACGGDELLRRQVESFLEEEERAGDFLAEPIFSLREEGDRVDEERLIGPYRLLRELGSGGMGAVYLAERADGQFEQQVAVKLLKRGMDSDEIVRRFEAERQILARLEHPHVARLLDGGTTEDALPFFVMEYVAGEPIDAYCDARALPTRERLKLFRKVCSAVHFAHQNLVVHRDLKPSNILVTADGTPKLLDFGIAKLLQDDPRFVHTATSLGTGPLTPRYASPEQIRGEPVTTAADVYALGVLLYELLTGRRPYRFDTAAPGQIARAICEETPPRPSTVARHAGDPRRRRRRLAGDLDNIVLKAMRKEPERRFASAEQLAEDLRRHLEGLPVGARKDTFLYRTGKFVRRHAWGVATAAGVAVLILSFAVNMAVQRERIARERDRSQAVKEFLVKFLKVPDPSQSKGESLTVREALGNAVERLDEELESEPEIRADLLDTIGRVYRNLALNQEAKLLLEEALRLRRESLGDKHPRTAASFLNLANLEIDLENYERAEELVRQALEIQRRAYPEGHPDLARGIHSLAFVLKEKGILEKAEPLAREALAMKKAHLGDEHRDVATSLNTLASVLKKRGKLDEAEQLFRECLALRRKLHGAVDPGVANTLANLAGLLMDKGDPEAALPLHEEALEMRRKLYDGDHPHLVASFRGLGRLLALQGDYEKAKEFLEDGLAMELKLTGEDSRRVAVLKADLASVTARLPSYTGQDE